MPKGKKLYWGTLMIVDGAQVTSVALMSINDSKEQAVGRHYENAKRAHPGKTVIVEMGEVPFAWQVEMRIFLDDIKI